MRPKGRAGDGPAPVGMGVAPFCSLVAPPPRRQARRNSLILQRLLAVRRSRHATAGGSALPPFWAGTPAFERPRSGQTSLAGTGTMSGPATPEMVEHTLDGPFRGYRL